MARHKRKPLTGHGHELSRAAERSARYEAREKLRAARQLVRDTKAAKAAALKSAHASITAARRALPARLKLWREVNRAIMARAIKGERLRLHGPESF